VTTRSEWIYRGSIVVGYGAIHFAFAAMRMRFRADTLERFAQFLDPPLLQDRLLESLWFLHAQPPLLNFLGGVALKISPADPAPPLAALFTICGLASCGWLAGILRRLDVPRPAAVAVALLFVATPPFVLFRSWFFYPHLAQTLLLSAGYCFVRSRAEPGRWMAGGFWALAALVGLRSLYHPLFLLLAIGAVTTIVGSSDRRRTLRLAAGPAAIVLALCLKNLWLFGFFGTSSWGGNSLHRMMTETLDRSVIEAMVRSGELTPISLEWEFSPPEKYLEILAPEGGDRGVPALDQTGKTVTRTNAVNYNHWVYPIASKEYASAAVRMMREHPGAYLRSLAWTARRTFDPIGDDEYVRPLRFWIRKLADPWDAFEGSALYGILLALGLIGAIVGVVHPATCRRDRLFLAFATGTILWTTAIGIMLEYGENNRFRLQISALWWIVIVWAIASAVRRIRSGAASVPD
jgi:hypothetical protein